MPRTKPEPTPPRRTRNSGSVARWGSGWKAVPPRWASPTRAPVYRDDDGRPFASYAAAAAWLDAALARLRAPAPPPDEVTLGDWLDVWFRRMADSVPWSRSSRKTYAHLLSYFSALAAVPLAELRREQLQDVVAGLNRRGLAPGTVAQSGSLVRRALRDAVEDGHLTRSPAHHLTLPKGRRRVVRSWTTAEARRLIAAIGGDPLEALWTLLLACGLRIGEALALRWDDVDWPGRRVRLDRQMHGDRTVDPFTKSRRERWAPLPDPAWAALVRHRDRERDDDGGWLFPDPRGPEAPLTQQQAYVRLKAVLARAGVEGFAHRARHSWASHLLDAGVPLATVSELAGHKHSGITASTYAHSSREGQERALGTISGLFGPICDTDL